MPQVPIQVYLDSSDYSRLSDHRAHEADPQLNALLQYLLQAVSARRVEIRFSAIHVAEAAQTTPDAQPHALSRVRLMKRLSQGRCLIYWEDLVQLDVLSAVLGRRGRNIEMRFPAYAYSNDGQYYPDISSSIREFRQKRKEMLVSALKEIKIPAAQRRLVLKELAVGDRSELVQAMIKESQASLTEQLRAMPVTERFRHERFAERFLFGGIGADEFVPELFKGLFDPETLVSDVLTRSDEHLEFANWLRNQGRVSKGLVLNARVNLQYIRLLGSTIGKTDAELRSEMKSIEIDRHVQSHIKKIVEKGTLCSRYGTSRRDALRAIDEVGYERLSPSLATLAWALKKYVKDNLSNFINPRTALESDVGDMLHSVYMPYVDIFRADGYFASLLRERADELGIKLVGKLIRLHEVIEEVIGCSESNHAMQ
jgi:hypothetical protein